MGQSEQLESTLTSVSTAHLADACLVVGVELRCAPSSLRPVTAEARFAGPAQPVRHTGSVDVILEAIGQTSVGAVLVIDDDARTDGPWKGRVTPVNIGHSSPSESLRKWHLTWGHVF